MKKWFSRKLSLYWGSNQATPGEMIRETMGSYHGFGQKPTLCIYQSNLYLWWFSHFYFYLYKVQFLINWGFQEIPVMILWFAGGAAWRICLSCMWEFQRRETVDECSKIWISKQTSKHWEYNKKHKEHQKDVCFEEFNNELPKSVKDLRKFRKKEQAAANKVNANLKRPAMLTTK